MRTLLCFIKMFTLTIFFLLLSNVIGYKLLPMWWNVGQTHQFSTVKPNKITFNGIPLCLYFANKNGILLKTYVLIAVLLCPKEK